MQQPGTNTPTIGAVTAISATNTWASVRYRRDLGDRGQHADRALERPKSSIVPSPTPGADPGLTGVAARGSGDVYAVGNNIPSINGGVVQGLILRWNGGTWSQDTDPTNGSYRPCSPPPRPRRRQQWAAGAVERGLDSQPRLTGTEPPCEKGL